MTARRMAFLAACTAGLAMAGVAPAARDQTPAGAPSQAPPPPPSASAVRPAATGGSPHTPTFDVEFEGGPLAHFVATVQAAAAAKSHEVNVVVPREAMNVDTPPLSLKSVTAATALRALEWTFSRSADTRIGINEFGSTADGGSSSFAVSFASASRGPAPIMVPEEPQVSIFSIRESSAFVGEGDVSVGAARVIGAVDAALSLQPGEPAEVKFHPDSGILMIRGKKRQLIIADQLLSRLDAEAHQNLKSVATIAQQQAEARARIEETGLALDLARQRMNLAQEALKKSEELRKSGLLSDEEFRARLERSAAAENEVRALELRIKALQRQSGAYPGASGGAGAGRAVIVYSVRDLGAFTDSLLEVVQRIAGENSRVSKEASGDLIVLTSPDRHAALVEVFNLARRVRANNPELPGLSIEEALRGAKRVDD